MKIATEATRMRAIRAYERSKSTQAEIALAYGIHIRTFQRWLFRYKAEGSYSPNKRGHRKSIYRDKKLKELDRLVKKNPDATLKELKELTGIDSSIMSIKRALDKLGYRYKKNATRKRTRT